MNNPVYLLNAGDEPFEVMALIKDCYGMSFRDARDFVTNVPSALPALDETRLNELLNALIAAGASVGNQTNESQHPQVEAEQAIEPETAPLSVSMADILLASDSTYVHESEDRQYTEDSDEEEFDEYIQPDKDLCNGYIHITGMTPELSATKLVAIKNIVNILNLGLKEAKEIIDTIPCKVAIPPTNGPQILVELKKAGFILEV